MDTVTEQNISYNYVTWYFECFRFVYKDIFKNAYLKTL